MRRGPDHHCSKRRRRSLLQHACLLNPFLPLHLRSEDARHAVSYELGWRRLTDPSRTASRAVLAQASPSTEPGLFLSPACSKAVACVMVESSMKLAFKAWQQATCLHTQHCDQCAATLSC